MKIYFIGIGGAGIGPLALMAHEAGYEVAGSDLKDSSYVAYLRDKGLSISLVQDGVNIAKEHQLKPIDWVIGVSSIIRDDSNHAELIFAKEHDIQIYERDALLNKIISDHKLHLIAVAGTHGKTTTTAMIIWIMHQLKIPISYSVGAKLPFAEMSKFNASAKYFIYECDEFHKNFLHFHPHTATITGIAWDHHEIFKTEVEYDQSFIEFLKQSKNIVMYNDDLAKIGWVGGRNTVVLDKNIIEGSGISIPGKHFREDAWLAINAVRNYSSAPLEQLITIINSYPGSSRRMEKLAKNLYSDYAHTPEKITGCITTALEMLSKNQKLVIVYEPLTNRRQHFIREQYRDLFLDVDTLYWVPSYKAREDATQRVIEPKELIAGLSNSVIATPSELNDLLWDTILEHQNSGDFIVLISGGGGGSLDEWARNMLQT